jgi:hypothetical protein
VPVHRGPARWSAAIRLDCAHGLTIGDRDRETGCISGSGFISFQLRTRRARRERREDAEKGLGSRDRGSATGRISASGLLEEEERGERRELQESAEGTGRSATARKRPREKEGNCSSGNVLPTWPELRRSEQLPFLTTPRSRSRACDLSPFRDLASWFSLRSLGRSPRPPRPAVLRVRN